MNMKLRRQKPMGDYIADFVCHDSRWIIEVDGWQHQENTEYDQRRGAWLRAQGYVALRFWNNELLQQTENVPETIRQAVETG